MRTGIARLMMLAAVGAMVVFASSTAAWAVPGCPTTTPSFTPDFTGAAGTPPPCLTLNGSASLPTAGSAASITSWSGASGVVTFQAANSFAAGEPVILSNFGTSTYFNGLSFPVLAANLSPSQFSVAFSGFSGSGMTESGTATPVNFLQLTPASTGQAGSAWYNTQQLVTNAFSTTFTFQLSGGMTAQSPADGIAFVIQNSGLTALGPSGCGVGFGDDPTNNPSNGDCGPLTGGIADSVAIEFKTYNDAAEYPNATYPNGANSVSIMTNNYTGENCIDDECALAVNGALPITLADGNIHTVTISYALTPTSPATSCAIGGTSGPCLDVILDGNDLFPGGVAVNLAKLSLTSGTAYVGFTGGTGGGDDNQDILSWTFAPQAQSQTQPVTPSTPAQYSYNGGCTSDPSSPGCTGNGYNNSVGENPGSTLTINNLVVTAIPIVIGNGTDTLANQQACNAIVNPPTISPAPWNVPLSSSGPAQMAQCFVYTNGGGQGIDAPVLFSITCPGNSGGQCDSSVNQFLASITSYFSFTCAENSPLLCPMEPPNSPGPSSFGSFTSGYGPTSVTGTGTGTGLPAVGFLQGVGPDSNNPCSTQGLPANQWLFQTNQIVSYSLGDTSSKPAYGGSLALTSCFVVTYDTPGEISGLTATVNTINGSSPMNGAIYTQGSAVSANFTCTATSTDHDSILDPNGYPAAGPYLTVSSCSASSGLTAGGGTGSTTNSCNPPITPYNSSNPSTYLDTCSGTITLDTTDVGPQTLTVDVEDSAMNTAQQQVTYTVVPTYALTTAANPSAGGSVSPASGLSYASGTMVPVTETANAGYAFTGWSGACTGTGSCTVTMSGLESVTANFVPLYVLTTGANPSAGGTVSPGGSYTSGTMVPVTEMANPGYAFTGWSGACTGTGPCTVTMSGPESVTANFLPLYVLTTGASPSAGGSVSPGSGGSYTSGTKVPVTETANPGYVFTGWSGACSGTGACVVTMNAAESVTANFGSALGISPSFLAFGTVNQGTITTKVLTLINNSTSSTITMSEPFISLVKGQSDAFVILSWCGKSLLPGGKCEITVSFLAGPYYSPQTDTLYVMDNAPGNPQPVTLTATVVDPQASVSASSLSFGTQNPHSSTTKTVTLKNTGGTALTITAIAPTGSSAFTVGTGANACGSSLAAGSSCLIYVTFEPTTKASYSGTLQITDNAITGSTQKVTLTGAGN